MLHDPYAPFGALTQEDLWMVVAALRELLKVEETDRFDALLEGLDQARPLRDCSMPLT